MDLALLDDAPPIELDGEIFRRNLEALRRDDADLAERIAAADLPRHWRPVRALDGSPAWRTEPPAAPPQWLGGSAAPKTRGRACLAAQRGAIVNLACTGFGAGVEIADLLPTLPPHAAVFIFENDLRKVAAVLRTHLLDEALRRGALILHDPADEAGALRRVLERHPGLRPPTRVVALPDTPPERVNEIRALCETVVQQVAQDRRRRIEELGAASPSAKPDSARTQVAIVALSDDSNAHWVADGLHAAVAASDWRGVLSAARGPRQADASVHAEAVLRADPSLLVAVDCNPAGLPLTTGRRRCQWHIRRITDDRPPLDPDAVHLAASPTIASDLRRVGVPDDSIRELYWAAPQVDVADAEPESQDVVLFADLLDASPEACGVVQPTHRTLWTALHETAERNWATESILDARSLLTQAERACGVRIGEPNLRARLAQIVEHVLIPAVVVRRILRALQAARRTPLVVGRGWANSAEHAEPLAASVADVQEQQWNQRPLAAIIAGPIDPLGPALLQCA
ncbi:MAG: hypothetical protein D6744_14035, partial [Planctomycetota bacterium]